MEDWLRQTWLQSWPDQHVLTELQSKHLWQKIIQEDLATSDLNLLHIQGAANHAFKAYQLQQANVERLEQTVIIRAARVLEATQQSYLEGEASLLEYLDALRVKLDASLGFYDLLFQLERGRVELEKAVSAGLR